MSTGGDFYGCTINWRVPKRPVRKSVRRFKGSKAAKRAARAHR